MFTWSTKSLEFEKKIILMTSMCLMSCNLKPVAVSKQHRENLPVPITKASHYSNLGGDNMAMTNLSPSLSFSHFVSKKTTSLRMLTFLFQPGLKFHFDYRIFLNSGFYFSLSRNFCGFYSKAASNQGRLLFKKIRYM